MSRRIRLLRPLLLSLVATLSLAGCWNSYGLPEDERAAVLKGDKALVLLRIDCAIDGQAFEVFDINHQLVTLELGDFDSGGEPKYARYGYLSEESCRAGWAYLTLSPGIYYLTVLGPKSEVLFILDHKEFIQAAPRWRLDVPKDARLVYAGTIRLVGTVKGKLLFGDEIINPANSIEIAVIDEHELAGPLLAEQFPDAGPMKTVLMQRWRPGEPIIIRSPIEKASK